MKSLLRVNFAKLSHWDRLLYFNFAILYGFSVQLKMYVCILFSLIIGHSEISGEISEIISSFTVSHILLKHTRQK